MRDDGGVNRIAIISLVALILVGVGACAARQMSAYKGQVNQVINQHFDASQCLETGRYHFRIKIDKSYNVVAIHKLKDTPNDGCAAQIKSAIQASSPLPTAPALVQYKIFEDGFGVNY